VGELAAHDSGNRDFASEADRRLVKAIADGSADALGRLYDRHAGVVFGLARRIVDRAEDAEEVVQDVFAQVWRQAARYRDDRASVAGWIVMLARTRAIDRLRARRARPDDEHGVEPVSALPLATTEPDPEALALSAEHVAQIRSAYTTLPDNQRSLLDLAYYQGLSHSEIAKETGVPLGTVKTRIRAAMEALRQMMDVKA
jgi:RNA polymerase sigma-70 factor (ECF subfamily)